MADLKAKVNSKLSWADELTPQRIIVIVILLVIIIVIIWLVSNQIKKLIGKMKAQTQIADEEAKGVSATLSDAEYYNLAKKLEDAMYGAGTRKQEVLAVFKQIKNNVDFLKLDAAFGIRSGWLGLEKGDLNSWLQKEGDNLINEVNQILAQNGVTKRFY